MALHIVFSYPGSNLRLWVKEDQSRSPQHIFLSQSSHAPSLKGPLAADNDLEKNVAQTNVKANNIGIGYGLKDMLAQIFVWGAQTLPPGLKWYSPKPFTPNRVTDAIAADRKAAVFLFVQSYSRVCAKIINLGRSQVEFFQNSLFLSFFSWR